MGDGVFKRPEVQAFRSKRRRGQKPARVKFPTVTQVKARVGAAYDAALKSMLAAHFSKPPPKQDLAKFAALLKTFVKSKRRGPNGKEYEALVGKYRSKNPKSTLSKYFRTSGTASWLKVKKLWMTGRGKIMVKFSFSRSALQKAVRSRISAMKPGMVKAAAILANPKKRSISVKVGASLNLLPAAASAMLTKKFIAGIAGQTKRKKLYLKASYTSPNMNFTSTLPIKRTRKDFNIGS